MAVREEYLRHVRPSDPWHEPVLDSEGPESTYDVVPYSKDLFKVAFGIAKEMIEHERPEGEPLSPRLLSEDTPRPSDRALTQTPILGQHAARAATRLRLKLVADPDFLLRKGLYAAAALTIGAVFSGMLGVGISVLLAAAVLIAWGVAGLLTFALIGRSSFDPRLAFVLLMIGIGTIAVGLTSIVLD